MVGAVLWLQYGIAVSLLEIAATSVLFLDHGASAFSLRPLQNGRPLSVRSSLDRSFHENVSKDTFFLCGVPSSPATRRRCVSIMRPTNTLLDSSREGGDSVSLDDVSSTAKEEDVAASLVQQETLQAGGDNNTDPSDASNNEYMKAALEEAEALRSKARKLMAEATEAEATLREFTSSQKSRRDKESDAIVAQILTAVLGNGGSSSSSSSSSSSFSEDGTLKLRAMANVLREHHASLSIHALIRVVERIHEREKVARRRVLDSAQASQDGKASGKQFQIGDTSQSMDASQTELTQLAGLLDLLVDAASIVDDERQQEQEQPSNQEVDKEPSSQQQQQQHVLAERDYFGAPGTVAATLRSRIKELRRGDDVEQQRQLGAKFNSDALRSDSESVQDYVRRTIAGASSQKSNNTNNTAAEFNVTKFMMGVVQVPRWVPNTLLPFVVSAKKDLALEDAKLFRSDVLGGSRFYCTSWDSMNLAAIYRGNFMPDRAAAFMGGLLSVDNNSARTTNSTISMKPTTNLNTANLTQEQLVTIGFQNVRDRLAEAEGGLGDRIQLFLVEDPEWRPGFDDREPEPRPVILALPASVEPEQASERDRTIKVVTALSTLLTLATILAFSVTCFGLNPTIFNSVVNDNDTSQLFRAALPIFLGVLGLQVIHEAAHFLVAKKTGVKIGLPVPVPSLQIGTFGSITPLRSFPETRTDLLDVALVGPAITMVLSLLLMVGGIWGTIQAPAAVLSGFPMVPAALCKTSLLVGSIVSALAPKIMMLPLSQPIPIHPAFMIGFTGLLSSAVNLLPIGRLDGGRICTAILGRRQAILASFFMLVALAALALSGMSTISIFWGLIVVCFQRYGEIPIRDEVTQVSDLRSGCYVVFLLLSSLAIAPFPGGPGSF